MKIKKPKFSRDMHIKAVFNIAQKEIKSYFFSPLAYVVFSLFIVVVGIVFFGVQKFTLLGTSDLTPLFTSIAFSFVIIIPALLMSSISKERQTGTIEFVLTQPVSEFYYLLAKFLSSTLMVFFMLLTTLPITIIVSNYGSVGLGQVCMQYLGAFILGVSIVGISLVASSIFKNEVTTLITSIIITAIFIVSGTQIVKFLPGQFDFIVYQLSLYSHYNYFSKGVLDIRDALYFISFIATSLCLAYYFLVLSKYPARHKGLRKITAIFLVLLVTFLVVGFVGQVIPGRIDLSRNKAYTLSDDTKKILKNIDGTVDITLYISNNLPIQFQSDLRSAKDLLNDYDLSGGDKINLTIKNPDDDEKLQTEASEYGVEPLVFSVRSDNSAQQTAGYFGIGLKYNEQKEGVAFIDESINIEFELTKKIKKLTSKEKSVIGFLSNNVAKSRFYDYQAINQVLSELYDLREITLDSSNKDIPDDIKLLVLLGPNADFGSDINSVMKNFVDNGGAIFLLSDPVTTTLSSSAPEANEFSLAKLFEDYGITVNTDLVYDRKSNNLVNVGSSVYQVGAPYPLWVIASSTGANIPVLKDIETVSILWGSSISIDRNKNNSIKLFELLETSRDSNVQLPEEFNIDPSQEFISKPSDGKKTLAVAFENSKGGKGVVVGSSGFFSDMLDQVYMDQNASFALSSIEWLVGGDSLSSIQSKERSAPKLSLSPNQSTTLTAAGVGMPLGAVLVIGLGMYFLRRREVKKVYKPS